MICWKCQNECGDGEKFCAHCGAALTPKITETPIPQKKNTNRLPIILIGIGALVCLFLIGALILGNQKKEVMHCQSSATESLYREYIAYGSEDKISKIVIKVVERDDSGLLTEADLEDIKSLLDIEKNNIASEKGVSFDYSANMKDNILVIEATSTIDLNKVSDDYVGSYFVPFDVTWKDMSAEEFESYVEYWENITCG